jgi:hypothetical protein
MIEQLEKAIAHAKGEYDLEDIINLAENGRMQIWRVPDRGIGVTEFVQYPRKKRLRVVLFVGTFDEKVVQFFERLMDKTKCDGIEVIGRKGWVKALKPFGYEEASVVVVKDIGESL